MKKKVKLFLFFGFIGLFPCYEGRGVPSFKRSLFSKKYQAGENKVSLTRFGQIYRDHKKGEYVRSFFLNEFFSGDDYNYWCLKLEQVAKGDLLKLDFILQFVQGQDMLFWSNWPSFANKVKEELNAEAAKYQYQEGFFVNMLFCFLYSTCTENGFEWFSDIFQIQNPYTATIPINPVSAYKKRIRSDGGVLQIPFCLQVEPDGKITWHIGMGIKIFPQNKILIYNTVVLNYFYLTPFTKNYVLAEFKKILGAIMILSSHQIRIKQEKAYIMSLLGKEMSLSGDPYQYFDISPKSEDLVISKDKNHPTAFNVEFLVHESSQRSKIVYTELPFAVWST